VYGASLQNRSYKPNNARLLATPQTLLKRKAAMQNMMAFYTIDYFLDSGQKAPDARRANTGGREGASG